MRQRIFEDGNGNLCGEYPHDPAVGFVRSKRGLRRRLVLADERQTLTDSDAMALALKRYASKEAEIRDRQFANDAKQRAEQQRLKNLSFADAAGQWMAMVEQTARPKTILVYRQTIRLYLEHVGDHPLREFGRSQNEVFAQALTRVISHRSGKPISIATQHMHLRHLGGFIRWAYDNELYSKVIRIKKPKVPVQEMEVFSMDQLTVLKRFLADNVDQALPGRDLVNAKNLYRAFMLATNCLLRVGAIAHLPLANIDIAAGVVKIRDVPELGWKNKGGKWPNKPINANLADFLADDLANRSPAERWFLDDGSGNTWYSDYSHVSRAMGKACRNAGLPDGVKPFHWGMRAALITWLLNNGETPQKVQQLADHSDIQTTMRYYNTREAQQRDAVDRLPVF
ncbi:site-specific integrase [Oceanobacter sp. 4_MG-2023]|uniref:tyrosine-type recombinase/integrase n=1 Tax=Oceanobacter sp. 4_MG-2023 TaxID=3062623 RepID=UPI002735253A|nr:site-specific integrase [Oceanobacter sp. 4_MG-2023]MDP2548871.1 site-specific integrase [Oceanobacter sp. 4_MG-2023]